MFDTSDFVLSLFDFVGCYNPFNRFRVLFRCPSKVHEYAHADRQGRVVDFHLSRTAVRLGLLDPFIPDRAADAQPLGQFIRNAALDAAAQQEFRRGLIRAADLPLCIHRLARHPQIREVQQKRRCHEKT